MLRDSDTSLRGLAAHFGAAKTLTVAIGLGLSLTPPSFADQGCEAIPDMFCVSQRVDSLFPDGKSDIAYQLYVYRFHDGLFVEVSQGNPPKEQTEELACVEGRTYRSLMTFSFSPDWRQGVAAYLDPGMSTVEFLNCLPDE